MGLTFKEDCPDLRNSKVEDIILELKEYGVDVVVADPLADKDEAMHEYGVELTDITNVENIDAIVMAVAHKEYKEMNVIELKKFYAKDVEKHILVDVKGNYNRKEAEAEFDYWRL